MVSAIYLKSAIKAGIDLMSNLTLEKRKMRDCKGSTKNVYERLDDIKD